MIFSIRYDILFIACRCVGMADKEDSKSFASNGVRVRPPPPAPKKERCPRIVPFLLGGVRTRPEPLAKAYRLSSSSCGEVEFCPTAKSPGDDLFVFFRRLRPPDTVHINTAFKVYLPGRTKKYRTTATTSLLKFVCFYKCIF